MMMKNLLFLLAGVCIAALAWVVYQYLDKYVTPIFLTLTLISILVSPVKSKFSNEVKPRK